MKIALIGYGKMGHEIEKVANERNHEIVLIVDKDSSQMLTTEALSRAEVAIEFSTPEAAFANVTACINAHTPVVCGTTGWLNKLDEVKKLLTEKDGSLFYASNYSLGVNIFFKLNDILSQVLSGNSGYTPSIQEIHHTQKLDAPSGTAITLAEIVAKNLNLEGWSLLPAIEENKIPIEALREGTVPGTHTITYQSEQDELILTHRAKSRRGFALGAVIAAEYTAVNKGFLTMDNLLSFPIINKKD
ncbi:MAG TPA: 4-hydroxy-tetrahydrodipicolinate reductase [Tenuifilaceae bacterium]|nr:4-hydroxy-tetrahydrodipicolinate reductase [Tenuifilaceae bacterium]HQB76864.1 4-hydroxy-tetrahydrodipicolinate reductase [Tenuifilaceae bacterium]